MHARVATFEGGNPEAAREAIGEIQQRAASGPPEGVPAKGFLLLQGERGNVLAISLFETQEDLEQGDATLNSMDPPNPGAFGPRASVERYEVGVDVRA